MADSKEFQYPQYSTLTVSWPNRQVAHITFNRPEKRNALDRQMVDHLSDCLNRLAKDSQLKCLVFSGSGGQAFISGADIGELRQRTLHDALQQINSALFRMIETFPVPTIAMIQGAALGGGLELAMACDFRFCDETASMGQPELNLGIMPAAGGCYRLPRIIGLAKAKELIFSGQIKRGKDCESFGLVHQCLPADQLKAAVFSLAETICKQSQMSLRHAKLALGNFNEMAQSYQQALESTLQAYLFNDPEKDVRMQQFFERKK